MNECTIVQKPLATVPSFPDTRGKDDKAFVMRLKCSTSIVIIIIIISSISISIVIIKTISYQDQDPHHTQKVPSGLPRHMTQMCQTQYDTKKRRCVSKSGSESLSLHPFLRGEWIKLNTKLFMLNMLKLASTNPRATPRLAGLVRLAYLKENH